MARDQAPESDTALIFRRHSVRTEASDVAAFARAVARPRHAESNGTAVPHSFPIVWLASEEMAAAMALLDGLPIQIFQSFNYHSPLTVDTAYVLTVRIAAARRQDAYVCEANVTDAAGALVLEMKSELVMVRHSGAAEAAP